MLQTLPVLEMIGVSKSFNDNEVLHGIDLTIDQGEVMCLIGSSGSGKSTLLRCVNALEEVNAGEIRLDGETISGEGVDVDAVRQHIGIVFQSYNLFPHMRVLDNVTIGPRHVLRTRKRPARKAGLELLARVGLESKHDEYPDRLSGGQRQRVAIARALAMNPRVILLDEITSALDPELVGEVLSLVAELARSGMTMMIATHEMGFAAEVADKVCFLEGGEIYEAGPPAKLLGAPERQRTREFLARFAQSPNEQPSNGRSGEHD